MSLKSLKRHEGYLMVDHRAGGGLTEQQAILSGYDPKHCRAGRLFEAITNTCSHCGGAWVINPLRTREREYCKSCDHYICDGCHAESQMPHYVHIPFAKKVELTLEAASRAETSGALASIFQPQHIIAP